MNIMDLLDKRILEELTQNCRATYKELSAKIGFTANAVRKRIDKLIENGTLYSFSIRPTLNTMHANIALSLIETDGSENVEEFLESFGQNQMIGEVNPIITSEGGFYLILSDYIGADGALELGSFFRKLEHVKNVEMHPVFTEPFYHGKVVEFKPLEMRVMRFLCKDARMPIVDLAQNTNLSARRVRSILNDLLEGGGVSFSIRWNTAAAGAVRFFLRIGYDSTKSHYDDIVKLLKEKYPREFWLYWISTHEPTVFASFTVDSIEATRRISIDMKKESLSHSLCTWVCYPPRKFTTYPETWLNQLLESSR